MVPSDRPEPRPGLDDLPAVIRTNGILELFRLAAKLHRLKGSDRAEAQDVHLSLRAAYRHEDGTPHILVVDRIYVHSGAGDELLWATCRTHPVDNPATSQGCRAAAEVLAKYFKSSYPYPDGMIAIPLTDL